MLRLVPNWISRSFCVPGRRLKLHPSAYYDLGAERGGIAERWFSPTTPADIGPLTGEYEGLSFIVFKDNGSLKKVLLSEFIDELKGEIIGDRICNKFKQWPAGTLILIKFGKPIYSEYFVAENRAKESVRISNQSYSKAMVMLKLYGQEKPELKLN